MTTKSITCENKIIKIDGLSFQKKISDFNGERQLFYRVSCLNAHASFLQWCS